MSDDVFERDPISKSSSETLFDRRSAFSFRRTPRWPGTHPIFILGTKSAVHWSLLKGQIMTFGEESERRTKADNGEDINQDKQRDVIPAHPR